MKRSLESIRESRSIVGPIGGFRFCDGGEIVHHQVNAFSEGIPRTDTLKHIKNLLPSLMRSKVSPQHIFVYVIECKEMAHTMGSPVCRRQTIWLSLDCPNAPMHWPKLNRTKFVKRNHMATNGRMLVQSLQAFFLLSKRGSVDSFQVFVR